MKNTKTSAPLTSDRSEFIEARPGASAEPAEGRGHQPGLPHIRRTDRRPKTGRLSESVISARWPTHSAMTTAVAAISAHARAGSRGRRRATARQEPSETSRVQQHEEQRRRSGSERDDPRRSGRASSAATSGTNRRSQYRLISRPYSACSGHLGIVTQNQREPREGRTPSNQRAARRHRRADEQYQHARRRARSTTIRASECRASAMRSRNVSDAFRRKIAADEAEERRPRRYRSHSSIIAYRWRGESQRVNQKRIAEREERGGGDRGSSRAESKSAPSPRSARRSARRKSICRERRRPAARHPWPHPPGRDEDVAQQTRQKDPRPRLAIPPDENRQHENQRRVGFHVEPRSRTH